MTTKVQNNSVYTNKTELNKPYDALELLKVAQFKNAILKILSDDVMSYRIDHSIQKLYNCFAPFEKIDPDWDGLNKRNGYQSAITLLGLENENDLCDKLFNIVYEHGSNNQFNAEMVANVILQTWEFEIKNYFSTKNQ